MRTRIVAEIGCNHNGDVNIATDMLLQAHRSGATSVKFQIFNSENLVAKNAPKAEYQIKNMGSNETQLEMLKKLELSYGDYKVLKNVASRNNIEIFATAFDIESVNFLNSLGQNIWKIPSGEITNLPLLEKIRDLNCKDKEIILSTGMSNIEEIRRATEILEESRNTKFTLLHCNTDYPTQDSDMNILAMKYLSDRFPKWEIGLSDHSKGNIAAIMAIALGATFIEKHFTIDRNFNGPDQAASVIPSEFKQLCDDIVRAEKMIGIYDKFITPSECSNKFVARKSIVAKAPIRKGEMFTEENITCKRPGYGISPIYWHKVLGTLAEHDFREDDMLVMKDFAWEKDKI